MKKICIITGIFPPRIGGPATFLSRLALALIEKGYSIKVITYGDDNKKIPDYPFLVRRISLRIPAPFRLFLFIIYIVNLLQKYVFYMTYHTKWYK